MSPEELGEGDAALLAELEKAAFEHPWSHPDLAAELAKPGTLCLALRDGPRLAAAALFSTVLDEAELLRIATRPEARRRGHGRTLLAAALERVGEAGIRSVFLEVEENNLPARALYRQLGFERTGRRPAYYRNGTAAVLYRRDLAAQAPRPSGLDS